MVLDRKLSFVAFWFEGLDSEQKVKQSLTTLSRLGYTGVDWKNTCFDAEQDITFQLKRAKHIADDMGISTCSAVILGNMMDEKRDDFVSRVCAYVRSCAEAGIPNVNTAPGGAPDTPESWGKLVDSLDKITRVCEECGVDLALESVVGCLVHDFPTTQKMYSMINHPRLKLTLDPSHYHMYKSDIPAAIRWLGKDRIAHVHLKDAIGDVANGTQFPKEWIFPILGEGNIHWIDFFEALDDIGYDNHMAIEFEAWNYMDQILGGNVTDAARLSIQSANALIANYAAKVAQNRK